MRAIKNILKSNKAFTLQDLAIAIIILMLFTGTIGGAYLSIYQVQADTKIDSIATLHTVQIMEYIDKIAYEEVTTENTDNLINDIKNNENFDIPNGFDINIDVTTSSTNEQDLVKTVKLTLNYNISGEERSIVVERLKVKEL